MRGKALYDFYQEKGVCVNCGKEREEEKYFHCASCRKKRQFWARRYRERLKRRRDLTMATTSEEPPA
jgi:hypothetical protein